MDTKNTWDSYYLLEGESAHYGRKANEACYLFLKVKFEGIMAMPICLSITYGYFYATTKLAEMV